MDLTLELNVCKQPNSVCFLNQTCKWRFYGKWDLFGIVRNYKAYFVSNFIFEKNICIPLLEGLTDLNNNFERLAKILNAHYSNVSRSRAIQNTNCIVAGHVNGNCGQ